jgi:hypothetical protein
MQQHDFDALIHEEEQRFNMSEREEVVPSYKSTSPPYYREDRRNIRMKSLNKRLKILNLQFIMWLNKKLQFMVSKCLEELSRYLYLDKKIIILLKAKPTIIKGVLVDVKIRHNEPKLNQHNGSIVKRVQKGLEQRNS